jgi:methylthioribose-1-phosphate isomerase
LILNQSKLPYEIEIKKLVTLNDFASAIADIWVHGAAVIGTTASYRLAEAIQSRFS